jgi:glycosyltransferase involved in cell wall biosynthesis
MRIGVNTRFLLKGKLEGVGRYTHEIVKRMVEAHPEVEFHFYFDRKYDLSFIYGPNVVPHVINPPARHPILFMIWFDLMIPIWLKKNKIDVFLSPDNFCSLQTNIPQVLVTHDIAWKHFPEFLGGRWMKWYYQTFTKKQNEKAKHIIAVSEYTKKDIVESLGISNKKISVAYNGPSRTFSVVTENSVQNIKKKYSIINPYFLYVGSIHPRKNVDRLIQAFKIFKQENNSNHVLVLAGRFAWDSEGMKTEIENSEDIFVTGFLTDEELNPLMKGAFALVYVSTFEGFGIPILDAFHAEIPVITSNVSSMPEVAEDAAILVNPFDVKEIAIAMTLLATNPEIYQELIKKGKEQRKKFSWDKSAEKVFNELKKLNSLL